jgi:hypothetical protein
MSFLFVTVVLKYLNFPTISNDLLTTFNTDCHLVQRTGLLGRLAMVGRDWRLRTATSAALLFNPGELRCGPWLMILTGSNSQLAYQSSLAATSTVQRSCQQIHLCCSPQHWLVSCQQRHLWQPPVISGFLPSETCLERVGGGRRKWEFSLSVPVGLQEIFYMPLNLETWDLRLYFPSKGRCAADFCRP